MELEDSTYSEQDVGEYLREARLRSELTQKELAEKLNYRSSQFVSNWEKGKSKPPLRVLKKMRNVLGLKKSEIIAVLLGGQERMYREAFQEEE